MKTLYHFPLCPFSRQARILLKEKNLAFTLIREDYWLRRKELLSLNPSGELPILLEENITICGIYPIIEYLCEVYQTEDFSIFLPVEKTEIRRLISWFNNKFYREVTKYILDEKMIRLFLNAGSPKSILIRNAKDNLSKHISYISRLLEEREYLALDKISIADFIAAAHLSVLDFFDEIAWDQYSILKHWYSLIKSRPSFRPILLDRMPGFNPPKHYEDLDF